MKILFSMAVVCLVLAGGIKGQTSAEKPENNVLKITLAKTGADGEIVEDPETFNPGDIPIFCYVDLKEPKPTRITVKVIAVNARGLRPKSIITTLKYRTTESDTGAAFEASPKSKWAVGEYSLEIYLDDNLFETRMFSISDK